MLFYIHSPVYNNYVAILVSCCYNNEYYIYIVTREVIAYER